MYDELYEAWKKEKETAEIQALPGDFYIRLADYVKKIREESRMLDEKTTKGRLTYFEFRNVRKMAKELIQLRYRKALRKTMTERILPKETLTKEEEKLHGGTLPLAESYQAFLKDIVRGRLSGMEKEKPKHILLRFLKEVPAIIGSDMKPYGPFKAEDIATLPAENARILINQGVAVEVEAK
jgi:DNA replication factor GINS